MPDLSVDKPADGYFLINNILWPIDVFNFCEYSLDCVRSFQCSKTLIRSFWAEIVQIISKAMI